MTILERENHWAKSQGQSHNGSESDLLLLCLGYPCNPLTLSFLGILVKVAQTQQNVSSHCAPQNA